MYLNTTTIISYPEMACWTLAHNSRADTSLVSSAWKEHNLQHTTHKKLYRQIRVLTVPGFTSSGLRFAEGWKLWHCPSQMTNHESIKERGSEEC